MSEFPAEPTDSVTEVLDVLGVGFGPSNLALAIALAEHNATRDHRPLAARFIERQQGFGWHRGMLIEDATMQVSFLKDLVTLRNPSSSLSFLSYLHDRGRLVDFINYGSSFPTRVEFHDYLEWAAARFVDQVDYGHEVISIEPVYDPDRVVRQVRVVARGPHGALTRYRARNVVLATGLTPYLPEGVTLGSRIWHSRDLLHRVPTVTGEPNRIVVVGAGQSAAEVVSYLHETFPRTEICAVFSRYGYSPADDSCFANRIFDPGAVDDFYLAPESVKTKLLNYHANTNYSVVDPELIEDLYRRHYRERVLGNERLRFLNMTAVADAVPLEDRVELAVESLIDGDRTVLSADLVIYATGYRPSDPLALLGELGQCCDRDEANRLRFHRDYRIATAPEIVAGLYVQGATEHTHGISSTLLSNVAVRSGEIVASIAQSASESESSPTASARAHR